MISFACGIKTIHHSPAAHSPVLQPTAQLQPSITQPSSWPGNINPSPGSSVHCIVLYTETSCLLYLPNSSEIRPSFSKGKRILRSTPCHVQNKISLQNVHVKKAPKSADHAPRRDRLCCSLWGGADEGTLYSICEQCRTVAIRTFILSFVSDRNILCVKSHQKLWIEIKLATTETHNPLTLMSGQKNHWISLVEQAMIC